MASYTPSELHKKADKAFAERDQNRSLFEDCYEFMSPYRNTMSRAAGTFNRPSRQFDSTAQISASNFVNTIQSNFTPVFTKWAVLKAGPGVPEAWREKLNMTLEKMTDNFFSYLNASNFSTAAAEMYFEWGIGTGCLWIYEGDEMQPLNFVSAPISQMGILEGKYGTVDFRARRSDVQGQHLLAMWPRATIPSSLDVKSNTGKEKQLKVTECFYYDYEKLVWCYDVLVDKESIYKEEHRDEICLTPRWSKIPGFSWGIGPFIMSLADVKTLNALKDMMLRSGALDAAGVYTVSNSGILNPNTLEIRPNTFIPVERNSGENGPTIQRLDTSSNFQLQEYIAQGLQDQIRKTMLDNRLPAETPQPKTAFEIAQRMREFQIDIGSAYGRGMTEFIIPLFKRCLTILANKRLMELPEGFNIDNFFIQVQVVSPIAQTQQAEDVRRFMEQYQMTQALQPELAPMSYKIEDVPAWLTEMLGTPTKLLRPDAEREQLTQSVAQFVAAQQMAQQQGA